MKRWIVTFGVNVPVYGSMVIEAQTKKEAETKALCHYETGKKTDDEWESVIWHKANDLQTLWEEAEDFRLLSSVEEADD